MDFHDRRTGEVIDTFTGRRQHQIRSEKIQRGDLTINGLGESPWEAAHPGGHFSCDSCGFKTIESDRAAAHPKAAEGHTMTGMRSLDAPPPPPVQYGYDKAWS